MTAVDGREWLGSVQTYAQLAEGGVGRYVHVPGERTRLTYYVDEALKEAGFTVRIGVNPSAVKLLYEPGVGLLTGNGPQTIDAQARKIRSIVSTRPVLNGGPLTSRVRERGRVARVGSDVADPCQQTLIEVTFRTSVDEPGRHGQAIDITVR